MSTCRTRVIIWTQVLLGSLGLISAMSQDAFNSLTQPQEANILQLEHSILEKILADGTNAVQKPTRPLPDDECDTATRVSVDIYIRSFDFVDDEKMEYKIQLTFRQSWTDSRLRFQDMDPTGKLKYLTLLNSSQIWTPDTYFINGGRAHYHSLMMPNSFVRVFADGYVLSSLRISTLATCAMSLKAFPMDKQVCYLKISSYGYTNDDLVYGWKSVAPIQLTPHLGLAKFFVGDIQTVEDSKMLDGSSVITLKFVLTRDRGFYTFQIFVPCIVMVVMGWFSFWINRFQTDARVIHIGGTVFAATITVTAFNASVPKASYLKASDTWIVTCVLLIMSALAEYTLVHYLTAAGFGENRKYGSHSGRRSVGLLRKFGRWLQTTPVAVLIDVFSLIIYPVVFLVACIIFAYMY